MTINSQKIELLAAQKGLKLGELAKKARISRQTLSTIKGRGTCTAQTAIKLADALETSVTEFIRQEA